MRRDVCMYMCVSRTSTACMCGCACVRALPSILPLSAARTHRHAFYCPLPPRLTPSSSLRKVERTRASALLPRALPPSFESVEVPTMASSSSKKSTHGAACHHQFIHDTLVSV